MIKKSLFLVAIFMATTSLFSAEVSVFDAGNLDASNPYGLTKNEQVLLNNKNKVEKLNQNFGSTEAKLNNAIERIEGLQSIVEGNNAQIGRIEQRLNMLESGGANGGDSANSDLRKYVEESRAIQEKNNNEIKKVLAELSTLIDSINSNYVSKSDLSKMNLKDTTKDTTSRKKEPETKVETTSSNSDFTSKSPADILKEASNMYKSKDYSGAKARYEHLISINHRPAEATFMLGEIEYFNKSYSSAIKYYQKSIAIYDKANYTPKLLYHTAISFDKVGDKNSADKFYKFLKSTYPNSEEAKVSPSR
ncbi:tetratricopeptide repeat protein [Campylobacter sputorum]|uniref:tetratricopeptide repeat protein n=1 Tax=Campylobacter sputorum TaxID=206 RepID=UPI001E62A597|nr:tetratricopeptide repeat protein [Campylobacter sputorum]